MRKYDYILYYYIIIKYVSARRDGEVRVILSFYHQRPPDGADEREKSTCKESTIVADSGGGIMYGGEAEHDGCVHASATMSVACSCTTVACLEKGAKEESLETVEPGFIGDKKEVSCLFNHQLCT